MGSRFLIRVFGSVDLVQRCSPAGSAIISFRIAEKVKVAHPLMLRAIVAAKKKSDQVDAGKIADCPRCDFLPECHMAPTEIRDRRRTFRYRSLLVKQMVQMKNRVSGLLMEKPG